MFISYPHARFLSTFEGNKLNRGHLRRQSTQGWCHRPQGWRHHPRGWQDRPDRWLLGPLHAQVNPTGGSPGGPPTLPPIGPSCAGTGYHYQQRGPREHSQARAQNHGVNVQTLPTRRREQMPPPSIPTSPHQKAKKSRHQQHAVSYNPALTALSRKQRRPWPARTNVRTASHGLVPTDALSVVSYLISPR